MTEQNYAIYRCDGGLAGVAHSELILEGVREIADALGTKMRIVKISPEEYDKLREEQEKELISGFEQLRERVRKDLATQTQ